MKKIAVIGAGGFGREVIQLIKDINKEKKTWEIIGYFDDNLDVQGHLRNGFPVVGPLSMINQIDFNHIHVVCAVGNPKTKRLLVERVQELNSTVKFATLIHPSVVLGDENRIGEGSIICAGNVITTNVNIGRHVIINISSTIGHDAVIKDYSTVLPGVNVSGSVILHEGVDIGTGAAIIPGVEIGAYTIVGAGAVVTKSLPEHCTAVGVPAKPIKFHNRSS